MKRLAFLGVLIVLAACGGGGGGGSTPNVPPGPKIINTSNPHYLPMATGNTWTFLSDARFVDGGSAPLSCSCVANGYAVERMELYSPGSSTIDASFFFTKVTPAGATELTNIIGVENDGNTNNVQLIISSTAPYGLTVMDDSPAVNESWTDGLGDTSTITSINGTLQLQSGTAVDANANDVISAPGSSPLSFGFARGVGFTKIEVGSSSTTMTSFTVDAAASNARTFSTFRGVVRSGARATAIGALQHAFH